MERLDQCVSLLKKAFPDETVPSISYGQDRAGLISNMIKTRIGNLNVILKISPNHPEFRKQLKVRQLYLNEIYFYRSIAPKLAIRSCPKMYIADHESEILVMEDLAASGYQLMSRDAKYVPAVYKAFAEFHARSLALKETNPATWNEIFANAFKDLDGFNEESALTECILEQCQKLLPHVKEAKAFRDFMDLGATQVMNNYDVYKDSLYSVVIHGDSWMNNIMIKGEDQVKFIDFQQTRIGSIVQDLSYFYYTCCDKEDYASVWDWLKVYHDCLLQELQYLGVAATKFSFDSLKDEWKRFSAYGLGMSVVVLHGQHSVPGEFPDFETVLQAGGNIFHSLNFISKREDVYNAKVSELIDHFVQMDFLPK